MDGNACVALVIEDDEPLRELMAEILADEGMAIVQAESADAGLLKLEASASSIKVVVSDIMMPGKLNGIALAEIMASRWPEIPVVLTSGYFAGNLQIPGHARFIPKPWRVDSFLAAVQQTLTQPPPPPSS